MQRLDTMLYEEQLGDLDLEDDKIAFLKCSKGCHVNKGLDVLFMASRG